MPHRRLKQGQKRAQRSMRHRRPSPSLRRTQPQRPGLFRGRPRSPEPKQWLRQGQRPGRKLLHGRLRPGRLHPKWRQSPKRSLSKSARGSGTFAQQGPRSAVGLVAFVACKSRGLSCGRSSSAFSICVPVIYVAVPGLNCPYLPPDRALSSLDCVRNTVQSTIVCLSSRY